MYQTRHTMAVGTRVANYFESVRERKAKRSSSRKTSPVGKSRKGKTKSAYVYPASAKKQFDDGNLRM